MSEMSSLSGPAHIRIRPSIVDSLLNFPSNSWDRSNQRVWSTYREMGGGHGGSTTYKGVTLHHPKRWHAVTGKGLCAVMWQSLLLFPPSLLV
ncbi:NADH dehydrogenase 1 beta subcomplex subunit 2 [Hibiscus syriacus]|uniref:NADH dehydrogenase 1 beta subcomplex subunit 2 n=1 Tax=Hibiscus syriacus TaxID=106335 RepID=A0A6A3D323_HIBSY|nr:NADH dehydrogenase 1 beta subcomplex subunit 2 [Hibiscus syriacus]